MPESLIKSTARKVKDLNTALYEPVKGMLGMYWIYVYDNSGVKRVQKHFENHDFRKPHVSLQVNYKEINAPRLPGFSVESEEQVAKSSDPVTDFLNIHKIRHLVKVYEEAKSKRFGGISGFFGLNRLCSSSASWQTYRELKALINEIDELISKLSERPSDLGFVQTNIDRFSKLTVTPSAEDYVSHAKNQFHAIDMACHEIIKSLVVKENLGVAMIAAINSSKENLSTSGDTWARYCENEVNEHTLACRN